MTRLPLALAAALALAAPSAASAYPASWFMTNAEAQSASRQVVREDYNGWARTRAYCRPQFVTHPVRGAAYHRWVCIVVDPEDRSCDGEFGERGVGISVAGSRYPGRFNWHQVFPIDCFGD